MTTRAAARPYSVAAGLALLRRRPGAVAAGVVLAGMVLAALAGPLLIDASPVALATGAAQPPSTAHPFGTDLIGRDVLSRVLHGGRISLRVAAIASAVAVLLGTTVGALAGYAGGRVDAVIMRLVDALLAVPRLVVLAAVFALWEGLSVGMLATIVGATAWFPLSRLVRAEVQGARTREYVLAARALGVGPARTLWRHILPGVMGTVIVAGTFVAGGAVTLEAALSFLGAGVEPEIPSWGNMVAEGAAPGVGWWIAGFPGLAIVVTVTAINLLGDALRDALDPRQLPRT